MDEIDFQRIELSKDDIRILKIAKKSKNRHCDSSSQRLIDNRLIHRVVKSTSDGAGGILITREDKYMLSNDADEYLIWLKKKRLAKLWQALKKTAHFWIPVTISTISLIVSIIGLLQQ